MESSANNFEVQIRVSASAGFLTDISKTTGYEWATMDMQGEEKTAAFLTKKFPTFESALESLKAMKNTLSNSRIINGKITLQLHTEPGRGY